MKQANKRNKRPMIFTDARESAHNIIDLQSYIKEFPKRLFRQSIIALFILMLIFTFKLVDNSKDRQMISTLQYRINKEFHYKEAYTMVMAWGNRILAKGDNILAVFNIKIEDRGFVLPLNGKIIVGFNEVYPENGDIINGIVIAADTDPTVLAAEDGVIMEVNNNQEHGNYIIIKHRGDLLSVYKHLEEIDVTVNQRVIKGERIGRTTTKLIYEIWHRKSPINPMEFINISSKEINL